MIGKILALNALALAFLAACIWFVSSGHEYFAIASLVMAALTSHTYNSGSNQ